MAFGEGLHKQDPKKRKQLYMIAGVGALGLAFLFLHSRSQAASQSGYTQADLQNAAQQAAQQQAQTDQSAYGAQYTGSGLDASNAGQLDSDIIGLENQLQQGGTGNTNPLYGTLDTVLAALLGDLGTGKKNHGGSHNHQHNGKKEARQDARQEARQDARQEARQDQRQARNHGGSSKHHGGTKRRGGQHTTTHASGGARP